MRELQDIPDGSILGLNFTGLHDSAIAVVDPSGSVRFACALERLTRRKKDGRWPAPLLDRVPWDRVAAVALSTLREDGAVALREAHAVGGWPAPVDGGEPIMGNYPEAWRRLVDTLRRPLLRFDHHEAHAASAHDLSGFDRALIVTCDAGASQCPWFAAAYEAEGDELRILGGMAAGAYRSPANLYTVVTAVLGLQPNNHEGKVTGLAARASVTEAQVAQFEELIWPHVLDIGSLMRWDAVFEGDHPAVLIVNECRARAIRAELDFLNDAELAACVQTVAERMALQLVERSRSLSDRDLDHICLAGGLFANVRINQKVIKRFAAGFVAPPMTDDGTALGAALLARRQLYPEAPSPRRRATMFLGPSIDSHDARDLLAREGLGFEEPDDLADEVAGLLADDLVVAVARGAMEFGPRALGHRSILFRPVDPNVNDWLNEKLSRTEYMPFAPMTPRDESDEFYTDARLTSRFMTVTVDCTNKMKARCPAVVHVDGTARPQILDREDDPFLHDVLQKLFGRTGTGTVLNTSFNIHEEPMVCSVGDALEGFARARLDALCVGSVLVRREDNEEALERLAAARPRGVNSTSSRSLALSDWLTETQRHLTELSRLKRQWFDPELQRLQQVVRDVEKDLNTVHQTLQEKERELGQRDTTVRQLMAELGAMRSSLTWRVNRVFDSLRRRDFRQFKTYVKGFLGSRIGSLARRMRGQKTPIEKTLQQLAPTTETREVASLDQLRRRVTGLLPESPPRVTAVVPCYNYGRLVGEAVASLRAQTYPGLEILVVDDGSTDRDTLATLDEIDANGVRVIHQENKGLVGARHAGAAAATGEYLVFLDNDDLLQPEAIALLVVALLHQPERAFAYPQQHFFGDENLVWEPQEYNAYDLLWANHPSVCSMIRRSAFETVHGYNADMVHGWEDWEHWVSLAEQGLFGTLLPVPVFKHRRHGRTMTHDAEAKGNVLWSTLLDAHAELYSPGRISVLKRQWRPAVCVIMPFWNAHEFFDETLQSLQRQTFDDFELIIVNDASDDPDSLALLEELRSRDDLRVLDRPKRGDLAAARNTGVLAAKSELVFFLDPDDILAPSALEKLVWLLLLSPEVGFVYSGVVHFGDKSGTCLDDYDVERLKRENFLTSAALVRKDVYRKAGGMEEGIHLFFEDYDFWLRLAALGIHGKLLPEPLFFYRRHTKGRSEWVRQQVTDGEVHKLLRTRNPVLWGTSSHHPEHYRPMAESEPNDWSRLFLDFQEHYRRDLGVPHESFRRANVPNPFMARHWTGQKTRVLYIIPHMTVGGAERVDVDILQALEKKRFHVTLVVERETAQEWQDRFEQQADELFILPHLSKDKAQWRVFLEYLLMSRNIDVVFNRNTFVGYEMIRQWHKRYREVRFVDLLHLHAFGEDWVRASVPYDAFLHRRFLITDDLRNYIETQYGLSHDRFRIIHCGVDTARWDSDHLSTGKLRSLCDIPADAPIVAFVGRLDGQKDPLAWLQVAKILGGSYPTAHFVVIGDGPLAAKVRSARTKISHAKRIHLLGYRDDVDELLVDADVLLLTSRFEGLPLVVFEAMSLGVPVVSSDAGGTRECVTEDLGVIVPLDSSPAEFAKGVATLLDDSDGDTARRAACVQHIRERFDGERMRERYRDELELLKQQVDPERRLREYQLRLLQQGLL